MIKHENKTNMKGRVTMNADASPQVLFMFQLNEFLIKTVKNNKKTI